MSDVFEAVDPTPGYRYDAAAGRWVPDVPAAVPSAQLEPELQWTPDVSPFDAAYREARADGETYRDSVAMAAVAESQATPNPYAVGSIFHTSWGYDQTNVEYYTVVRETAASVWLVPMGTEVRDGRLYPTDPPLWTMGASDDPRIVSAEMHRKGKHGTYVRMDDVRHAYPYNGGGCYDTYAAGGAGH